MTKCPFEFGSVVGSQPQLALTSLFTINTTEKGRKNILQITKIIVQPYVLETMLGLQRLQNYFKRIQLMKFSLKMEHTYFTHDSIIEPFIFHFILRRFDLHRASLKSNDYHQPEPVSDPRGYYLGLLGYYSALTLAHKGTTLLQYYYYLSP